ncbi:MAG: aromatic acid exporter family protein [Eubacteriales bacterium]|nr:aromatic acid exporter family protein [Eubacteriales bacterium]
MQQKNTRKKWRWPHIGQRMIKTSVAVFICLLILRLLGYRGETMPAEATITAIICMQPYISDTRAFAIDRFTGTIIGTIWGVIFLFLLYSFPFLSHHFMILYAVMGLGVLLALYTSIALNMPDVSGLSAIVFMCIVIQFPEIETPHLEVARRFLGVMIGTTVAITVNISQLPRTKKEDCVFFVRGKDLTPNRFSQIPPSILFFMNRLYEDGAKICIMLEHAPALFTMQMSSCQLSIPLIVMDGAAIYDTSENRYLSVQSIPTVSSACLTDWFRRQKVSYFTYTIRNNRTCIFHDGPMNEQELLVLKQLQRSPYRSYLDGENLSSESIVYFKVIAPDSELHRMKDKLQPLLRRYDLRAVVRAQASTPGVSGLYIFSKTSTPEQAQKRLMDILQIRQPNLHSVDIFSKNGYHNEHDAAVLLHRLRNAYEPVSLFDWHRS